MDAPSVLSTRPALPLPFPRLSPPRRRRRGEHRFVVVRVPIADVDLQDHVFRESANSERAGQAIDSSRSRAILAENLIGFPWAVEIKVRLDSSHLHVNHLCCSCQSRSWTSSSPFRACENKPRATAHV